MTLPIVYVYPGAPWGDYPGRQGMLTGALSRQTPVVFLECGAPSDRYRLLPRAHSVGDLTIVRDAMRLRYSRVGRRFAAVAGAIDGRWLSKMLREIGVKEYVLWLAANDPRVLRGMDCTRLVYDCIDPCFRPSDQIEFDRREREIATRARCVFATARSLWDRVSRWNSNAFLLPNGVQEESLVAQESSLPSAVAGIGHPVVGYLGTVDWRFDAATVREAARALPNVVFCIAGRVNPDREQSIVDLRRLSNVVVTGPVSAEEGKALMLWFDVGFIPFTPGPMNDAINPCKMYMHLRAGSPVVATNIRECRECAPWVFCPTDTRDMTETIRAALAVAGKDRESRCAFAVANSWTVRAKQALEVLQTLGLLETATTVPLERQPPVGRRLEAALGRTGL